MHVCMHACIIHACMYACMHVYMHTERHVRGDKHVEPQVGFFFKSEIFLKKNSSELTRSIHPYCERHVRGDKHVEPQVEFFAANEVRVFDVALRNVHLNFLLALFFVARAARRD